MKITADIFHAHLKCPMKCWLRATGETSAGNTYQEWVMARNAAYRTTQTARLIAELPYSEVVRSPGSENVKDAKWRLASSLVVQATTDSCVLETELHAIVRLVAQGQRRSAGGIDFPT